MHEHSFCAWSISDSVVSRMYQAIAAWLEHCCPDFEW
jgi:hypothetical protein